ncbi:MAG: GNAT family N-acetyltransferase [Candidatus Onthomonas sp.]
MAERSFVLRPYRPEDLPQIAALFYDTVHTVNARDYTPAQLDAWADGRPELARWNRAFLAHFTLVAVSGETVVGFGDVDDTGYLDRLYVHRNWQGRGIGSDLCDCLESRGDCPHTITHASITARPFFQRRGYRVLQEQQVERRGVLLTNFVMEKIRRELP